MPGQYKVLFWKDTDKFSISCCKCPQYDHKEAVFEASCPVQGRIHKGLRGGVTALY